MLIELQIDTISSLPFPLEDEEIYEPPQDEEQGEFQNLCCSKGAWLIQDRGVEETIDEATSRVVSSLPRIQAIEALHGYQRLKYGGL